MSRLDPRLLLSGYASGVFPMADSRDADELFWVEPQHRAILPLDRFHVSRSLARRLRSGQFSVTLDRAFAEVVRGCADRRETWINGDIERATLALHSSGHAHSIECRDGTGGLVGGLYGVKIGRAFFGESMFSRSTDASKVALAWLVARLIVGGYRLLDCQFMTEHLGSLGAVSVERDIYVELLGAAVSAGSGGSGAGGAGAGASLSAGASGPGAGGDAFAPDFFALDRLLDATGAAGSSAAAGKVIAQLLGQTS